MHERSRIEQGHQAWHVSTGRELPMHVCRCTGISSPATSWSTQMGTPKLRTSGSVHSLTARLRCVQDGQGCLQGHSTCEAPACIMCARCLVGVLLCSANLCRPRGPPPCQAQAQARLSTNVGSTSCKRTVGTEGGVQNLCLRPAAPSLVPLCSSVSVCVPCSFAACLRELQKSVFAFAARLCVSV